MISSSSVIGISFITLVIACTTPQAPQSERSESATGFIPLAGQEEHKVSELAQLMRDMVKFADSTKQRLAEKKNLLPFPTDFKKMITTEATPGMVDHRVFDPFAFAYLHQLDSLYTTPRESRQEVYNELIQYCAACHGNVCPGPLTRIKKLYAPKDAH